MPSETMMIRTSDGDCRTSISTPEGDGPWPAAIMFMDGMGIRPALVRMAERLAAEGFVVLLPDLFFRFGPYGPLDPTEVMAGDFRAVVGPMMATTDNLKIAADTQALIACLDSRTDIRGRRIGVVGFCMGGAAALTVAGLIPDRVAAAASFHGGNLANDTSASPHLLAPRITGEVYVAGADNDQSYPPEMAERLGAALSGAGVVHCSTIYEGARHGWMMNDFPVHDAKAADRGWSALIALFDRTLG